MRELTGKMGNLKCSVYKGRQIVNVDFRQEVGAHYLILLNQ